MERQGKFEVLSFHMTACQQNVFIRLHMTDLTLQFHVLVSGPLRGIFLLLLFFLISFNSNVCPAQRIVPKSYENVCPLRLHFKNIHNLYSVNLWKLLWEKYN